MPIYNARCSHNHLFESFQTFAEYDAKKPLVCPAHNTEGTRLLNKPMVNGTSSFRTTRDEEVQLGKRFNSAKEMEDHLKANKLEKVDIDADARRCAKITKDKEAASIKKFEDGLTKELSKHSHIITENGLTPLGE